METHRDLLIIGGGLAGLSAAKTAMENGMSFEVFEVGGELGGRVRSAGFEGVTIEEGPNWITGTQGKKTKKNRHPKTNPIWKMAQDVNL